MNETTKTGLNALGVAFLLGLLGDGLLRATPWGLNLYLWIAALTAGLLGLWRRRSSRLLLSLGWLLGGLLVFAAAFAWRDSPVLRTLDIVALFALLALTLAAVQGTALARAGVWDYLRDALRLAADALYGGLPLLFGDITWRDVPRGAWSRHSLAVLRGVLIALPLLLIFGGLLAAADAVFSHYASLAFRWDIGRLASHVGLTSVIAWLAGGILRAGLGRSLLAAPSGEPRPPRLVLGPVETGIVLGLLDLLFLGFVLIQIRYFFGGAAHVQATVGLTYAEYARRGFFELVWVAALVLPLLLALHGLQAPDRPAAQLLFRILAGLQVALLFVIMASAVIRMRLYQAEYGLTELRFYTSAFMGWLALVFLWFALTVLRGHRPRFAIGALLAAFAAVLTLHALNPDALIVRANFAHARAGHEFDADYATRLSLDAVPALSEALPSLDPAARDKVARALQLRRKDLASPDWRTWTLARAQARTAIP